MTHVVKHGSLKWLIRALSAGGVFVVFMAVGLFGTFPQSTLLFQASGACLALCLIVGAVAFVFEVVRRVTSA